MIPKIEPKRMMPSLKSTERQETPTFHLHTTDSEEEKKHHAAQAPEEQKQKKKKEDQQQVCALPYQTWQSSQHFFIEPASKTPIASPLAIEIMEKASTALVMLFHEGNSTTTVTLDDSFSTLPELSGSQIIIEEFSSAPKVFNVRICTTAQGLQALEGHLPSLVQLFEERKFGFSINRIETELLEDRPLLHRKDHNDDEDLDQQNKRQ